jgi:hypothetical protein
VPRSGGVVGEPEVKASILQETMEGVSMFNSRQALQNDFNVNFGISVYSEQSNRDSIYSLLRADAHRKGAIFKVTER